MANVSFHWVKKIKARTHTDLTSAPIILDLIKADGSIEDITIFTDNVALSTVIVEAINGAMKAYTNAKETADAS